MSDAPAKLSALAVVSFVFGVIGIVMLTPLGSFAHHGVEESFRNCLLLPVAAVISAVVALRLTRKGSGTKGRVFAFVGLVFGGGVVALLFTVMGLRIRAVRHFRICGDNLEQIEDAARDAAGSERYNAEPENQMRLLFEQLPNGRLPECPGRGTYNVDTSSGYGVCSEHGDVVTCNMGI